MSEMMNTQNGYLHIRLYQLMLTLLVSYSTFYHSVTSTVIQLDSAIKVNK